MLCVINANRPETDHLYGCFEHIARIQAETGLKIDGLINNTHMLRETTPAEIIKGYRLCKQISEQLEIPIVYNTCHETLVDDLLAANREEGIEDMNIYPIRLYMRPTWLDK